MRQVVLIPIALGAFLNRVLPRAMARLSPFAPLLASAMTVLVSASIISQNAAAVRAAGPRLILAVASLHTGARRLFGNFACLILPWTYKSAVGNGTSYTHLLCAAHLCQCVMLGVYSGNLLCMP